MLMRMMRSDLALGLMALGAGAWFLVAHIGLANVALGLVYWVTGALVIFLWDGRTTMGRIIAVILIPAVLLQLCLPRPLRNAVAALPCAEPDASEAP